MFLSADMSGKILVQRHLLFLFSSFNVSTSVNVDIRAYSCISLDPWCDEPAASEAAASSQLVRGDTKQEQLQSPPLSGREDAVASEASSSPRR